MVTNNLVSHKALALAYLQPRPAARCRVPNYESLGNSYLPPIGNALAGGVTWTKSYSVM